MSVASPSHFEAPGVEKFLAKSKEFNDERRRLQKLRTQKGRPKGARP